MARAPTAFQIDRWASGYERQSGQAILRLDFPDREPMMLAVPLAEGKRIANALMEVDQGGATTRLN